MRPVMVWAVVLVMMAMVMVELVATARAHFLEFSRKFYSPIYILLLV